MDREVRLITTEDGSHSLYLPHLNETYHSSHGAITESEHVFIQAGLDYYFSANEVKRVKVLEVGFGTGLNAWLSWNYSNKYSRAISMASLEPFPRPKESYEQLNYPRQLQGEQGQERFLSLHEASWDVPTIFDDDFSLEKRTKRLEDFKSEHQYELVYFDAFAPNKQAELWELTILEAVAAMMGVGGVLVTYCARGQFKRDLRALGLEVQTLPGPPGKKEMVRGLKL